MTAAGVKTGVCLAFLAAGWCPGLRADCLRPLVVAYPHSLSSLPVHGDLTVAGFTQRLGQLSGCAMQTPDLPPARAWEDFRRGRVDLFWGLQTPQRDPYGEFLSNGIAGQWNLVMLAARTDLPRTLRAFIGHPEWNIGMIRGTSLLPDLASDVETLRKAGQIDESTDTPMAMTKVEHGRDAAYLALTPVSDFVSASPQGARLRTEAQRDYQSPEAGIYLSRQTLSEAQRKSLHEAFDAIHRPSPPVPSHRP